MSGLAEAVSGGAGRSLGGRRAGSGAGGGCGRRRAARRAAGSGAARRLPITRPGSLRHDPAASIPSHSPCSCTDARRWVARRPFRVQVSCLRLRGRVSGTERDAARSPAGRPPWSVLPSRQTRVEYHLAGHLGSGTCVPHPIPARIACFGWPPPPFRAILQTARHKSANGTLTPRPARSFDTDSGPPIYSAFVASGGVRLRRLRFGACVDAHSATITTRSRPDRLAGRRPATLDRSRGR
jgi:hypothetical protein